uniref:NADH dehydrogenase subunit 4L n=1 Tax=Rosacea flaccida TaxID=316189 RepID=UPI0026E2AEAE|nr:NADH dehydrogenase subunit 4L [Rosacea flaccida]WJJ70106.1 NADH dehydrogenase subunit 4L [Rosacea flaccida]
MIVFYGMFVFILCLIGILIKRRNLISLLIFIELMFISLTTNFLIISYLNFSSYGQIISLSIIIISAAETAIALSLLVSFYRIRGNIGTKLFNITKGRIV